MSATRDQDSRQGLRRTGQHKIALHSEEAMIGRSVTRCLYTLDQVSKSLRRYRVIGHHKPIMRRDSRSDNRRFLGKEP